MTKDKHPGGRPTNYKPGYCQELVDFFNADPYEDKEIEHFKSGEKTWTDIKRMSNKLPTMIEFARHIGVGYRTLFNWLDKESTSYQEEFWQTYTRIAKELQKNFLVQNGLEGLYNPVFAKFVALNFTNMVDKKEVELSSDPDKPLKWTIEVVGVTGNEQDTPMESK